MTPLRRMKWFAISLGLGTLLFWAIVGYSEATQVNLAWDYTQGTTPAATFSIHKQPSCAGPFTVVQTQGVALQTWTDTGVTSGQTYCWYVTAVAATGEESTPSNTVQFRVPIPPPAAPTALRGTVN